MKELGLFRHAKSDWKGALNDHDRPLAARGVEAARLMGRFVQAAGLEPDGVFSSTAERARETIELAADAGKWACPVEFESLLYLADRKTLMEHVRRLEPGVGRVILVGHNPGYEEFLSALVGGGSFKMPTAALAWVRLPIEHWDECGPASGTLHWLVTPKLLDRLKQFS